MKWSVSPGNANCPGQGRKHSVVMNLYCEEAESVPNLDPVQSGRQCATATVVCIWEGPLRECRTLLLTPAADPPSRWLAARQWGTAIPRHGWEREVSNEMKRMLIKGGCLFVCHDLCSPFAVGWMSMLLMSSPTYHGGAPWKPRFSLLHSVGWATCCWRGLTTCSG